MASGMTAAPWRWAITATLTLLSVAGCNPTYAPPIRAVTYGAPGRLPQGRMEISGAALVPWAVGGPQLAVGIRDWLAVEGGANLYLLDGHQRWTLGHGGLRFTASQSRSLPARLAFDFELGAGGGLGGVVHGNDPGDASSDGRAWNDRIAWGGYQGIGFGLHARWFAIYLRGRVEESTATNVPLTIWGSGTLGLDFDIVHRVVLSVAGGAAGYWNNTQSQAGVLGQAAITVYLDYQPRPPPADDTDTR